MDILVIALAAVALWGMSFSLRGHEDYLSRESTGSVKGIFAVIILYSHMRGYVTIPPTGSYMYSSLLGFLGQLMVVMFLLYSGYGVMEGVKKDRARYVGNFLTHRLLKVWIMFAMAVALFFILAVATGQEYSPAEYLLCWTGWESIGNSNWFVFDILVLYLLTYVALRAADLLHVGQGHVVVAVYILTLVFLMVLIFAGKGGWWYDTVLAYPTGMLFSIYRGRIEKTLRGWRWVVGAVVCGALFFFLQYGTQTLGRVLPWRLAAYLGLAGYLIASSVFALLVVMITMKLKFDNAVLRWLGGNAFAIYILQRLAMIVCAHYGINGRPLLFAAIVIPSTLLIAALFTSFTGKVNRKLFKG